MSLVIITCLESIKHKRDMMLAATNNRMLDGDYVYLFVQTSATGFGEFFGLKNP
jgi:hypothetical protein